MRSQVVATLVLVGLAGCASTPDVPTTTPSSSSPSLVLPPLEQRPLTTDTLHLLEAPHMAGRVPSSDVVLRQAIPSAYGNPGGSSLPIEWTMPRPDLPALTGEVAIWVEVQGTVANAGYAQAGGCFWIVWIAIVDEQGGQTEIGSCQLDAPIVEPGVRQVRWELPAFDVRDAVGTALVIGLQTTAAPGTGGAVTLLSGTKESDSILQLDGLQVPLDTTTLLL